RPMLQMNRPRRHFRHVPIFFIFIVSNIGGLLTPLGDPPLFLGFLKGVDFFWTLSLWREWLLVNGWVLAVFYVWGRLAFKGESTAPTTAPKKALRLEGAWNFLFLAGILLAVVLRAPRFGLTKPWSELVMAAMAFLSLWLTPRGLRQTNRFTWGPI